jgi:hypothetical protein
MIGGLITAPATPYVAMGALGLYATDVLFSWMEDNGWIDPCD